MEPITTTAIATILSYWGGKAFEKVFDTTAGEFTKESITWLKSLFFKDDKPRDVLEKFEDKPESPARQNAIKAAIESELEDNPQSIEYILQLAKSIEAKTDNSQSITKSKNINTGTINSGGITILGDNNQF